MKQENTMEYLEQRLDLMVDLKQNAIEMHDWNMAKAYEEQIQFIAKKIKKLTKEKK